MTEEISSDAQEDPAALVVSEEIPNEGRVPCPHCAELVLPQAVKCKHCGSHLGGRTWFSLGVDSAGNWFAAILSLLLPGLGQLLQNRIVKAIPLFVLAALFWLSGAWLLIGIVHLWAAASALVYMPSEETPKGGP